VRDRSHDHDEPAVGGSQPARDIPRGTDEHARRDDRVRGDDRKRQPTPEEREAEEEPPASQ